MSKIGIKSRELYVNLIFVLLVYIIYIIGSYVLSRRSAFYLYSLIYVCINFAAVCNSYTAALLRDSVLEIIVLTSEPKYVFYVFHFVHIGHIYSYEV